MAFFEHIVNAFAPHNCLGCQIEGYLLCPPCGEQLDSPLAQCFYCPAEAQTGVCKACAQSTTLQAMRAASAYKGLAKQLVWQMKFQRGQAATHDIATLLHRRFPSISQDVDVVSYLPTATTRQRVRGYDHSALIAREYARLTGLPCLRILGRTGQARQVGATAAQRQQIRYSLYASQPYSIQNKNVLLIDDVITTGASMAAAAKCLTQAGAAKVEALVFARTPLAEKVSVQPRR